MSHKLGSVLSVLLCMSLAMIALPAVAQEANGAGTRSAIPSTRNKPGLRHEGKKEDKKDKKEAAQEDGGKEADGGEGATSGGQGTVKANGAGTRSAIPSTRNKPGLRHETQPDSEEGKEEAAQQDQTSKAAE